MMDISFPVFCFFSEFVYNFVSHFVHKLPLAFLNEMAYKILSRFSPLNFNSYLQ